MDLVDHLPRIAAAVGTSEAELTRELENARLGRRADISFDEARLIYRWLFGCHYYRAVDLGARSATARIDLNYPFDLGKRFDLVINNGTSEHIFNQANVFAMIYNHTRVGGHMVHWTPVLGWVDHGLYNVQPSFFLDLAKANAYDILSCVMLNDRAESLAVEPTAPDFQAKRDDARFANSLLCACMRRRSDDAFRVPQQAFYSNDQRTMLPADQALCMIKKLDIDVFRVETQTTLSDRTSLLRVQNFARSVLRRYVYLEVGSHIGGSLFPHLIDSACEAAISVDPRPPAQPDERAEVFAYEENSAARMVALLSAQLLPAAMGKLTTIDSDVSAVRPEARDVKATLALIDGEHTDTACFSDFVGLMPLMKPDCIVSFHDSHLIADAIRNAERFLDHLGVAHETVFLPDVVAVMGLGALAPAVRDQLGPHSLEREAFLDQSRRQLWSHIADVRSADIRAEVERLRSDNTRLLEESARARESSRDAEARLAAIMSSTVWRASAPARTLVDRIKRRFGSYPAKQS